MATPGMPGKAGHSQKRGTRRRACHLRCPTGARPVPDWRPTGARPAPDRSKARAGPEQAPREGSSETRAEASKAQDSGKEPVLRGGNALVMLAEVASPAPLAQIVAQIAPAVTGIRLSLHVLAATVWVGGQITVASLLPAARSLGPGAPRRLGRAFARLSWPAYAVLLATGVWNMAAVSKGQGTAWKILLGVKVAVVLLAGLAALLHSRARTPASMSLWGPVTGLASLAALVMGVFLAG
jgi:hypothetical protein